VPPIKINVGWVKIVACPIKILHNHLKHTPKFQTVPGGNFKMPPTIRNTIFSKNGISFKNRVFSKNLVYRGFDMTGLVLPRLTQSIDL